MPVFPFLMFTGNASQAIEFYSTHIKDAKVLEMKKYGEEAPPEMRGKVEMARLELPELTIKIIDSPPVHDFDFTPATSFFIECEDAESVNQLAKIFSEEGQVLMPLDSYPFSERYCWVTDKFGVSWQFGLEVEG